MLTAIENAKELVKSPEWPRSIHNFPQNSSENCWGFALDGLKIPALRRRTWYSSNDGLEDEIFDFLQCVDLNPRKISSAEEKSSEEMVFLFYVYSYSYFNVATEDFGTRSECHVARIECDGTVVEKASSSATPVITSVEGITNRIFDQDNVLVEPILFAVRKPR